jgi:hypothetical protein
VMSALSIGLVEAYTLPEGARATSRCDLHPVPAPCSRSSRIPLGVEPARRRPPVERPAARPTPPDGPPAPPRPRSIAAPPPPR